ncbi:Dihydrolipoamide dehydrogenase of branched-chain alpha-keto acid dehydrogenase [hydrothermal vent metagenome]|uniref:Dihydrolipoamide dehydrogenase of branched-chain alpha-keto acid dehydrogenase n=1 Tax=hydrothermal vent metagenome TaxID=652676 RepID=A0A1W1CLT5_9ZZZZ
MYDIIYIGGGLNYAGAIVAAKNGKKVALIESDMNQLGGVCLHKGCIPSKMFLHYSNLIYESQNEIVKGSLHLDMKTLFEKKDALLKSVTKVVQKQCSHIELIEGKGKLVAPHQVEVNGRVIEGEYIIIGTGSSPFIPDGIAYNAKDIIISDDVLNLQKLPKKIAIYGTGAVGLEMASFFATAGVEVTLINRNDKLLKKVHPTIESALQAQLEKLGVNILSNHPISKARSTKKGVHIAYEDGSSNYIEMLLVATGRKPNVDVIACEGVSIKDGIVTDAYFETTLAKHYAIGDCNGKLQLAHAARAEALNVTQQILGNNPRVLNLEHVVKFIHTLPMSYAVVGKTKMQLESEGIQYKESLVTLNQFTYSVYNHASKGLMVSFVDEEGFILGAEILAPNAEELIATVAMSLAGEMDATQAKRTILAHPTFSEALERTFYKL